MIGQAELPIDACLEELRTALRIGNAAVLIAPPGAGKTTRVPLALLGEPWATGRRIIVLEPRRIAARSAATYMAGLLGEKPGETVGYRVRMDSRIGQATRIEVVTEGVFVRMILEDPELRGVAAVLFDECHERNLDGDLALALALDVQSAFRPDLRLLPMSATLDGTRVATLIGSPPIIKSTGRAFDVEIRHQPPATGERLEDTMASTIRKALAGQSGSILCFLPGQAEILRTAERLTDLPQNVGLCLLYGAVSQEEQDRAIRPTRPPRRKIVLASSIAQTSITIDGVEVVIDSGLARIPAYEPETGVTRLQTVRASKAAITQRSGRAGRTAPGIAIRLWHEGQTAALPDFDRPAILTSDLTSLALDLARWGVSDPGALRWIDAPPAPAFAEARRLLQLLGAVEGDGRLTPVGGQMAAMPLEPRLAHMVLVSADHGQADEAANLAVLTSEQGSGGRDVDIALRLDRLNSQKGGHAEKTRQMAKSIARGIPAKPVKSEGLSLGALLSLAWPDRIAKKVGADGEGFALYHLANGRRARLDGLVPLAKEDWLTIIDLQGSAASARILSAASVTIDEIRALHGDRILRERSVDYDEKVRRFKARQVARLGAVELQTRSVPLISDDCVEERLVAKIRNEGLAVLSFGGRANALLARMAFAHQHMSERFPAAGEAALIGQLDNWLLPFLAGVAGAADLGEEKLVAALYHYIGHDNRLALDRLVPSIFETPAGSRHALRYEEGTVKLAARVQEFYGLSVHPHILDGRVPLVLELLSPAGRPIQTTTDIGAFWSGSWRDVRSQMRGRYPRHPWPENPAEADATTRAKPRGT
jgi:ATP-dependent helicase HrpB